MNILLWTLQLILALHTTIGAVWKFSNSEQAVPSLQEIPHEMWIAMAIIELLCSLALLLPALRKSLANFIPIASAIIAIEMLLFCGLHIFSGEKEYGPMIYWLVVAALCMFIAYGRVKIKPINA